MINVACTIVSLNYLPYARVLCSSFLRQHPETKFHVLLVDRVPSDLDLSGEEFELHLVEDLNIPNFTSVAFKYDVLELNTNVKPTFLKLLLRNVDAVLYLDPDIFVYRKLDSVVRALEENAIVLTPHAFSSNPYDVSPELIFLMGGVFNLGFIALRNDDEAAKFLSWWEERCLASAFNEPRTGQFVDQKWINLVPCFFDSVKILKAPSCNMAYWNLHERRLTRREEGWIVNESHPLEFFHFSGFSVPNNDIISTRIDSVVLSDRPDLRPLFEQYRQDLIHRGFHQLRRHPYAFATFDNGQFINRLTRSLYAANLDRFGGENPFCSSSRFHAWAKANRILGKSDSASSLNSRTYNKGDWRLRFLHALLRLTLRLLGAERYTALLKYMSRISILRRQRDVIGA
jgi:hypothetical protein